MKEQIKIFLKKRTYDWIFLVFAIISIILILFCENEILSKILITLNSILTIGYLSYAFYLFFFNKVSFDWHLVNGAFLRKVMLLVITIPLLLSGLFLCLQEYDNNQGDLFNTKVKIEKGENKKETSKTMLQKVYYHYVGKSNIYLSEGNSQQWAFLTVFFGIFLFDGVLIASIVVWISNRKERYKTGQEPYEHFLKNKKHYIIIGGNDMVTGVVKEIFEYTKEKAYILIQTSRDVESYRHELFQNLTSNLQKRIIISYGNRNTEKDIRHLRLEQAEEIYILGEEFRIDDLESYHDTMNMKSLRLIADEINKNKNITKKITCHVMFEYQATFNVFQFSEISDEIKDKINFKPFNYYRMWAEKVFVSNLLSKATSYLPLEGEDGITSTSKEYVHLIIIGMSRMGIAMGIEAAHIAHYPNYPTNKVRTKITFIDENAKEEKEYFIGRFPQLFELSHWQYKEVETTEQGRNKIKTIREDKTPDVEYLGGDFIDIEWEFINGNVANSAIQTYLKQAVLLTRKTTIAVCTPESSRNLSIALNLEKEIYENVLQILVYNRYNNAMIEALENSNKKTNTIYSPYKNKLKAFGMAENCYSHKNFKDSEFLAPKILEIYKSTQEEDEKRRIAEQVSPIAWYWSNIYQANHLWTKLRCNRNEDKTKDTIDIYAQVEHNRWNVERLLMQYRPLNKEEQEQVKGNKIKKQDKKREKAHLDICSNEKLREIDAEVIKYDRLFVEKIEWLEKSLIKEN